MKKLTLISLIVLTIHFVFAQEKRSLTFDDIQKWNQITSIKISNNGETIVYVLNPWKGDRELKITSYDGTELKTITGGYNPHFTSPSDFVVCKIKPLTEIIRELKLKKTKDDDMPMDKLAIFNIKTNELEEIERIYSYKLPEKLNSWIAYQLKPEKQKSEKNENEQKQNETSISENNEEKKKEKKEDKENGFKLIIRNLKTGEQIIKPYVTQYTFVEEKEYLIFVSTGIDTEFLAGIYRLNLNTNQQELLMEAKGIYKQIQPKKDGSMIAFLHDTTTKEKDAKNFSLYLWKEKEAAAAQIIVDKHIKNFPKNWEISSNNNIQFADKTNRLYFGIAPIHPEEDTTILKEEIPELDVWHYNEPVLQTVQIVNREQDLKKAFLAVYHIDNSEMVQLETPQFTNISLINEGDANDVLATSNWPYALQKMWESYPEHNDFYLVNVNTGNAKLIKEDCRATPSTSPDGKYVYWYNAIDTSWYTYNLMTEIENKVSSPHIVQTANELFDMPILPPSYGILGWAKKDEAIYVYDRYDIWKLDPEKIEKIERITSNGREKNISYQLIEFDNSKEWNEDGIDISKPIYLHGHNEITRADGYYQSSLKKYNQPKTLIEGVFKLNTRPFKAKDKNIVIFTKEDFQTFPDLLISDLNFSSYKKISDANPQQSDFFWGTAELYSWTSLDGKKLEGKLCKPENFDPNKKYPLIVNFYEKSSQGLYNHHIPENHRSTVDYHYYTSNGYIVFNPDIYYKTGYPGEDAFNCVIPGITQLIAEGYIDEKAIGAQGHSWGGYQVAYLATRTQIFAAIESGAPVVNMISAYGGIRWQTGLNRSFQYEHTQSRIGKHIWDSPLRYIENSPIFTIDKITTPILIMHNDKDGHVPWWQGIEFFIALRRLNKISWLLNYNNEPHWPTNEVDKKDFQIRMAQFFDHFLKKKPMPKWMKYGIPAIHKGIEMGYELDD